MKNKYQSNFALIFATLISLAGCGIYTNIYSNYNRSIDFSKYKTFAWLPDKNNSTGTPSDNDIVLNNTKTFFNRCFSEKGYNVNINAPDVLLQLVLLNEEKEDIITAPDYSSSYYFDDDYYNPYYNPNYYTNTEYYTYYDYSNKNYNTGIIYKGEVVKYVKYTIILNVIDRKLDRLVWTGTTEVDSYAPYYIQYDMNSAIHKLLKGYPFKPVKLKY